MTDEQQVKDDDMSNEKEYPDTVPFEPLLHRLLSERGQLDAYLTVALEMYEEDKDLDCLLLSVRTVRDVLRGMAASEVTNGQKHD